MQLGQNASSSNSFTIKSQFKQDEFFIDRNERHYSKKKRYNWIICSEHLFQSVKPLWFLIKIRYDVHKTSCSEFSNYIMIIDMGTAEPVTSTSFIYPLKFNNPAQRENEVIIYYSTKERKKEILKFTGGFFGSKQQA